MGRFALTPFFSNTRSQAVPGQRREVASSVRAVPGLPRNYIGGKCRVLGAKYQVGGAGPGLSFATNGVRGERSIRDARFQIRNMSQLSAYFSFNLYFTAFRTGITLPTSHVPPGTWNLTPGTLILVLLSCHHRHQHLIDPIPIHVDHFKAPILPGEDIPGLRDIAHTRH